MTTRKQPSKSVKQVEFERLNKGINEELVEEVARIIASEYPNQTKYTLSPRELAYKLIPIIRKAERERILNVLEAKKG